MSAEAAVPANCRLILAADNLLDVWGSRTDRGERITVEWGEPGPEGWYEPVFTAHSDDRLGTLDEAWKTAEAALPEGADFAVSKTVGVQSGAYVAVSADAGVHAYADTPAAALLALATALRGVPA